MSVPTPTPLDGDKLAMVPRIQAASAAHLALFGIQDERPEVMVMGAAVLFTALCHRCGLDPEALHTMGRRVLLADQDFHRETNDSLQSLRDFAGLRVKGDREVSIS